MRAGRPSVPMNTAPDACLGRNGLRRVHRACHLPEYDRGAPDLAHAGPHHEFITEPCFLQVVHLEANHVDAPPAFLDLGHRETAHLEGVETRLLKPVEEDGMVQVREAV